MTTIDDVAPRMITLLEHLRMSRGLSRRAAAEACGVDRSTFCRIETGVTVGRKPHRDVDEKLARFFKRDAADLRGLVMSRVNFEPPKPTARKREKAIAP